MIDESHNFFRKLRKDIQAGLRKATENLTEIEKEELAAEYAKILKEDTERRLSKNEDDENTSPEVQ